MKEIYLDNAATTKVKQQVVDTAVDLMRKNYGNPSSLHRKGFQASQILDQSREQVASLLGCSSEEVFFTSGGTEANNLAILGVADAQKRRGKKIITTAIEHASVLEAVKQLETEGFIIEYLPPLEHGEVDIKTLESMIDAETILVSVGLINSEVGTIANLKKISETVKKINPDTIVHTDGVQGFGKIPFSVKDLGADLISISGHKIHAPKGVGALYVKKGTRINPRVYGGGQEKGLRSGTEGTPAIGAFGKATALAHENLDANYTYVSELNSYFYKKIEKLKDVCINSHPNGTPYICNISLLGYRSETVLHYLAEKEIYISSGSACSKGQKSHVLSALKYDNRRIDSALRISFNNENTYQEIDYLIENLVNATKDLIRS